MAFKTGKMAEYGHFKNVQKPLKIAEYENAVFLWFLDVFFKTDAVNQILTSYTLICTCSSFTTPSTFSQTFYSIYKHGINTKVQFIWLIQLCSNSRDKEKCTLYTT